MTITRGREAPLWWVFLDKVFYFLINLDSFLAWIPSYFLLQLSFLFSHAENSIEKTKRFVYIQAIVGPHIYAGLIYFLYRIFDLDWRLLSVLIFFYFGFFIFQYRMDRRLDQIAGYVSIPKRKLIKVLVIFKFIFTTWAFLTMGVLLSLP